VPESLFLIFYLELTKTNTSTTITSGAKSFLVPCAHTQLWPCCQHRITLRQGCVLDSRMRQLKMAGYDCLTKTFCFGKGDGSRKGRRSSEVCRVVIQQRKNLTTGSAMRYLSWINNRTALKGSSRLKFTMRKQIVPILSEFRIKPYFSHFSFFGRILGPVQAPRSSLY